MLWAQALEKYVEVTSDTSCRWTYKIENQLFIECEVHLVFSNTKKDIINIRLKTGVVTIQGQYYKEWSNDTFQMLKEFVDGKEEGIVSNI